MTGHSVFQKKSLGQIFLTDQNVIRKMIAACDIKSSDSILEIGPGGGALTKHLLEHAKKVIAIETDKRFCDQLRRQWTTDKLSIIHADILKYDLNDIPQDAVVFGNLPYYISSPIIEKLMEHRTRFKAIYLTVQLEFGKRMIAAPDTKDYSALTCFVNYYSKTDLLFKIKNKSFSPIPKVDSCFMRLSFENKPILKARNEKFLFDVIHKAFQQRRKTISNALTSIAAKKDIQSILESVHIKPTLRPENLTIQDYVLVADALLK